MKFKIGEKVKSPSIKDGRIIKEHTGQLKGMYDVRIWSGTRHVGDVTLEGKELKRRR